MTNGMITTTLYKDILKAELEQRPLLAILLDPDKFNLEETADFMRNLPSRTTHIFIGGSTVPEGKTETLVRAVKMISSKPIVLFPGDYSQLTDAADGVLYLSLLSGDNPEYLVGQQVKAVPLLKQFSLEVIPTAYLLIDGGSKSAVSRVTNTEAILQADVKRIVHTAKAGEFMGAKLVYLEAGSGAKIPVSAEIIKAVKSELNIPLIVGGGIRTPEQLHRAYEAGADMVVMGTVFEE